MIDLLNALGIAIGYGISTGIKYFFALFLGYLGLKLASRMVGPIEFVKK